MPKQRYCPLENLEVFYKLLPCRDKAIFFDLNMRQINSNCSYSFFSTVRNYM